MMKRFGKVVPGRVAVHKENGRNRFLIVVGNVKYARWTRVKMPMKIVIGFRNMCSDNPICRKLFRQVVTCTWRFPRDSVGNSIDARMAMIAMTTSSSIKVNAESF